MLIMVMVMNRAIIYSLVVLFVAGCSSTGHEAATAAHADAPPNARQLSASEIQSTVIGRKHSSVTATGYAFSETLNPDGTAVIQISSESLQTGQWIMTEDVICVSYKKYGKECNKVLTDGVVIWFVDSVSNKTNNKFTVK